MIIQEAQLFRGMSRETANEISKIMIEESHGPGTFIFEAGAPARHFYILIEGRVRLSIGTKSEITYTVSTPGEAFGWTGLVDRPTYTATANCVFHSKVMKIDNEKLSKILENDTASGMIFFKRLAEAVVQRLICNYESFLAEGSLKDVAPSYG